MPAKKGKTSWEQFGKYASNNPKLVVDLLKDPAHPNTVLAKYGKAPLSGSAATRWRKTWNVVISSVIGPGLSVPVNWGGVWPKHWAPGLLRKLRV